MAHATSAVVSHSTAALARSQPTSLTRFLAVTAAYPPMYTDATKQKQARTAAMTVVLIPAIAMPLATAIPEAATAT